MSGYFRVMVLAVSLTVAGCATGPARDMQLSDEGYSAMAAGDMETAERLLTEAVAVNPNNPYALINLGALYQNTGRPDLARPLYLDVIAGESDYRAAAKSPEEHQEVDRLVQLARDNLAVIYKEELARQQAAEAAAEPMPAPEPVAETPTEFVHWVQVGAFMSRGNAERLRERLMQETSLVDGKEVRLLDRGGFAKLHVGPYADSAEANAACRSFKQAGMDCFPGKR